MDITSVVKVLDEFNEAEPPTTKKAAKALVAAVTEGGIEELEGWLEEFSEHVAEARSAIDELDDADADDREAYYETATAEVAQLLESLADITPKG